MIFADEWKMPKAATACTTNPKKQKIWRTFATSDHEDEYTDFFNTHIFPDDILFSFTVPARESSSTATNTSPMTMNVDALSKDAACSVTTLALPTTSSATRFNSIAKCSTDALLPDSELLDISFLNSYPFGCAPNLLSQSVNTKKKHLALCDRIDKSTTCVDDEGDDLWFQKIFGDYDEDNISDFAKELKSLCTKRSTTTSDKKSTNGNPQIIPNDLDEMDLSWLDYIFEDSDAIVFDASVAAPVAESTVESIMISQDDIDDDFPDVEESATTSETKWYADLFGALDASSWVVETPRTMYAHAHRQTN